MRSSTRSRRRISVLLGTLAVLGLATGGAVVSSEPAEATSNAGCPAGYLCLYFNSDYQGARSDLKVADAALNNELFNDGARGANGWNVQVGNNAASVWNRTGREVWLFGGGSCSGDRYMGLAAGDRTNLDAASLRRWKYAEPAEGQSWASAAAYTYGLKNAVSSMWPDDGSTTIRCKTNVNQSGY